MVSMVELAFQVALIRIAVPISPQLTHFLELVVNTICSGTHFIAHADSISLATVESMIA